MKKENNEEEKTERINRRCENPGCTNKAVAYFRGYAYCAECYRVIKLTTPKQCL